MFFSKANNDKNAEIKQFIPVSTQMKFVDISPSIENADRDYIKPLLGEKTYAALLGYYNSNEGSGAPDNEERYAELLKRVQRAEIHLAFYIGFYAVNSHVDGNGFARMESDSRKTLYRYQEDNLRDYFKYNGFNELDDVLAYLEANTDTFSDFKESDSWTQFKMMFIPDTKTFDGIYFINASRLTFLRLKNYMTKVIDFYIKPLLGNTIYTYILDEMVKDTPAAKVVAILPYIQKSIAYLSVARLMQDSGADLNEKGLYFQKMVGTTKNSMETSPADAERVARLISENHRDGVQYLNLLKQYLSENLEDWTDFEGQPSKPFSRNNTDKKIFWTC